MKVRKVHMIVFGAVLGVSLCLISLARTNAQGPGKTASPTRVAVCDLIKVFTDYQRSKDLMVEMNERKQTIGAENEKRVKKLEELKTEMDGYKVGSKKHTEVLDKMRRAAIEREVWLKIEQNSVLADHRRLTEEMLEQIKDTIAAVARKKNIDLVLQLAPKVMNASNVQELVAQIDRRKVLYHKPGPDMDITAAVLQRINESYRIKK